MGAERPTNPSGNMFGRWGVGIGDYSGEPGCTLRAGCRHKRDRCGRQRRLCHRQREAAMAMMPADGLVIAMARGAVEDGGDLRATAGRGDVDIVRSVQRAREQIDDRDQHRQQPAPIARTASSGGLAVRKHDVTLVAVCARPSMAAGTVSTRNIVTSLEQLPQQCVAAASHWRAMRRCKAMVSWVGSAMRLPSSASTARRPASIARSSHLMASSIHWSWCSGSARAFARMHLPDAGARRSAIHAPLPVRKAPPRSHL